MFGLKTKDIEALNLVFSKNEKIQEVILYGSRAMDTYKNGSDIDLTIIDNGLTYSDLSSLECDIDDLLLPYKIDLSIKSKISNPSLISHIERKGKQFYIKK